MAGLKEVKVDDGESEGKEPTNATVQEPYTSTRKSTKRRRPRKRQSSAGSESSGQSSASGRNPGGKWGSERNGEQNGQPMDSQKSDLQSAQDDLRSQFYEKYRKEAEEYDREFMKKHDEDLSTTLIFAGLFSAVTSAFIIEVNPKLHPDPNDETNALLRILIYNINSTAFDGNVPTLPRWSGPPRTILQVQTMLYASLAASIFSALLAMLGKQWLNRYASVNMRGSAIERSQNRQRKLNGIVTWYFDLVLESLPLMLQFALLLLGSALSVYHWGIDTALASVILGVTVFGVILFAFVVIAGASSLSCPYQTPSAQVLRYLWQKVPSCTAFFTVKGSAVQRPEAYPTPEQTFDREAIALDFRCISWILRTSLDRDINLLTLKFLASILMLPGFKTIIAADCFKILISCVRIADNQAAVIRGSEQLAATAAMCLLGALSHSLRVEPTSKILTDMDQQYNRIFPPALDLRGLPFRHTIHGIHNLFHRRDRPKGLNWKGVDPSAPGNLYLTHDLTNIAWYCYVRFGFEGREKVPRWVLRFSLHSLLWSPEAPVSVITNCLTIVAIDLGCDISEGGARNLDNSIHLKDIVSMIYLRLEQIGENSDAIQLNRKPIAAFFLWATRIKILNESPRFDWQSHVTRRRFFGLWDRIHLTNPALAEIYLDALLRYVDVDHGLVTECPGLEQAARAASLCLLRALSGVDSGSAAFMDIRERYNAVIPPHTDFEGLLCYHAINAIHATLVGGQEKRTISWTDYKLHVQEHAFLANTLARVAHKGGNHGKVSHWALRFIVRSLSQDPPPPASVVTDCLMIIAIDLGCEISEGDVRNLDKSARLENIVSMIYLRLEEIGRNSDAIQLNQKPIAIFFLWATQIGIIDGSQRFDWQSHIARFFELWDQIHLSNHTLTEVYFDALLSCVSVDHGRVRECPGLEQGARAASLCLLRALSDVGPTSTVLDDIHKRYIMAIPPHANFEGLLCYHAINAIHATLVNSRLRRFCKWADYKPRAQEQIFFANTLARVAHKGKQHGKVPRWVLRFVIHSLPHDSQPPTSVVTDCLTIIAIDLGCDVSHPGTSYLRKSAQPEEVLSLISEKFETLVEATNLSQIRSKHKAITTLFPYAVRQERNGQHKMLHAFLHAVRASKQPRFMWNRIRLPIARLLNEESHVSLKQAVILVSPHLWWRNLPTSKYLIQLLAAADLGTPHTDEVRMSVVDTLFQIASDRSLQPYIPLDLWSWLNTRPSLPPVCRGRFLASHHNVLQIIRALRDVKTLKSFLLLVWSEWNGHASDSLQEAHTSIREDLGGIEMWRHRGDLLRRLDHILGQLGLGLEHLRQHDPDINRGDIQRRKDQYASLRAALLEVGRGATEMLIRTGSHSTFMCTIPFPCP